MDSLLGFVRAPALAFPRHSLICAPKAKMNVRLRAQFNTEDDTFLRAAINCAALRFQETHRPVPLLVDPYAGCLVPPDIQMDLKKYSHHYCISTKFIDDKLLRAVNHIDGLKQVVLFTDGMDTRPYRLNWPPSTIIFDISPERVFKLSAEKLQGVGAKIPRNCLFFHIPLESPDLLHSLHAKGFNGNRPSIWAIQGLPVMTLASFEEILCIVSSLAMHGCSFLGELPAWLAETELMIKSTTKQWIDKLFMSDGFRVDMINYNEVARNLGNELAPGECKDILFVAEQLRYSDDQMETWRRELQRVEEEGDEEGFEEL
ncbi:hypothetical protein HS088_TW18G00117 [Tripterygium wilfordii]|uniref:S-adenosyl-L-methionine-dependent methyltransferases superfamily protein n=1 Tax=Tripterygium wilfordii TaxID=458696 RepID=A0A7J7CBH0_TRIWF|nr:putative S-adenosyl-L-methionine-dependent methyltransferase MAV_4873 [Tripterygium wilfordii]KAF5731440.1 hypothetical protein HS088_TW18G00117 [Tripterygium wilfordii]